MSRTTSEAPTEFTVTEGGAITTSPSSDVEIYEVQFVAAPEEESISPSPRWAGRSLISSIRSVNRPKK